ncbi:MAG TPA: PAS domain S-box protein [Halothiobacillus sp.]|nr:PAS domain S-box protein [Halothiobacillus sp.]
MSVLNLKLPTRSFVMRFAQIFLPLLLIFSAILFAAIRFDQQIRIQSAEVREGSRVLVAKESVQVNLSAAVTDLRVLANLPALQSYLDHDDPAHHNTLEKIFLVLAKESERYDQIRYLDAKGQEQIRVNDNDGAPAAVPAHQLQNKQGRYYFEDSLSLDRGEIFMSPLDLNIEHHKLEIPYKPMIRFGTPVFDSAGTKKGVIILNYFGQALLHNFRAAMQGGMPHSGMLLNQDGYWLSSPQRADEWGFMLGRSQRTFAHDHPKIWTVISGTEHGTILTRQGLYSYDTVYPLLAAQQLSTQLIAPSVGDAAHPYAWKLVSFVPKSSLYASAFYTQKFSKELLALAIVLLALLSLYIAQITLSRQQARREITKLNQELEQRVIDHAAGEERLSVTLNAIGDGVLSTDAEGRVNRLNPVAEKLMGWSHVEAYGRAVDEVFHIINQQTRELATIPVASTLERGTIHGLANHTVLIARDGTERPIADSCAPIRDRSGKVIGAILVFRDVSQEYEAKQALIDSASRIHEILNAVADGIITINEHGLIETFNPAAERLFGYTADEIIGQNVKQLMPAPHSHQHDDYIARYLASGDAHIVGTRREVEGLRRNGSTFPMQIAVNATTLSGSVHFTGVIRDITENKLHEQQLVAAKESAEEANHTKDSFLATMSHEIRTPLTGILGMLEVLSMTPLNQDQNKTLQTAWESARGLLRIVSDILDWSKIQDGKLVLSPQSTSIPQLLQEVVNTYSRVASAKNLLLWQNADARLSAAHIVDALRLSQILNNFVSNAIKFTQHGEIELRADFIGQHESGEHIRFSVRDTGIGIAPDIQGQLFQRYRQGSADTARLYGGTGLGLSICRRLTELLDGRIDLVSEPGRGSTFSLTVILPVSAAPGEKIPSLFPDVEQRKVAPLLELDDPEDAPLVLAVDDHPINRELLVRQIQLLGLRVQTAENGRIALDLWRKGVFAAVITDCHMPEMDGYAFAQEVRQIERAEGRPRIPIIAWTANAGAEEEDRCQAAGMDDLLVKPADLMQLKQALANWLSLSDTGNAPAPPPSVEEQNNDTVPMVLDYAELNKVVPDATEQYRVLNEFRSYIYDDLIELGEMLTKNDQVNVEHAAHRMKGSSRMVGAIELAQACQMIEQAVQRGDMAGAKLAQKGLADAMGRFEAFLHQTVDRKGG